MSSAAQKQEIKEQILRQVNAQNVQTLLDTIAEKCFEKCVSSSPDKKLSQKEVDCVARCQDRYLDAFNTVNSAFQALGNQQ